MTDTSIRLYHRDAKGMLHDDGEDFGLEDFGGVVPAVGDNILRSGVPVGLDRNRAENREILTVTERYFNPRDNRDYIALVVTTRPATRNEIDII